MIEFYPQIKLVHVGAVLTSGCLFFIRGLARQFGASWPRLAPVRYLSYTVDTILLTAAFMLMTVLHQYPFVQAWLTVKLTLIVIYIVLGALALSHGRTPRTRWLCFAAAVSTFGMIVSIARTHHPLGFLRQVLSSQATAF